MQLNTCFQELENKNRPERETELPKAQEIIKLFITEGEKQWNRLFSKHSRDIPHTFNTC
jgi:hypothetical protein